MELARGVDVPVEVSLKTLVYLVLENYDQGLAETFRNKFDDRMWLTRKEVGQKTNQLKALLITWHRLLSQLETGNNTGNRSYLQQGRIQK